MNQNLPVELMDQIESLKKNFPELIEIRVFESGTVEGNYISFITFSPVFEKACANNEELDLYALSALDYAIFGEDYTYSVQFAEEEFIRDMIFHGSKEVYLWAR